MINIIGKRKLFLSFSGTLVILSFLVIFVFGFKQGIDFQGGALLTLEVPENVAPQDLEVFFRDQLKLTVTVVEGSGKVFLVRSEMISEESHQLYLNQLKEKFPEIKELSFQSIGPTIGDELKKSSMLAIVFVILGISAYIAFAFRKASRPVNSWKYGVVTLVTLFHDILIPSGLFAVLGYIRGVEIDTNFIVALLVVMGFSVHDTIVVFDRIRENLVHPPVHLSVKGSNGQKGRYDFNSLVNLSINETIARSINTSLTLVVVLIALFIFGPITLTNFVLVLSIGVIAGTYSSIFVASPLLTIWYDWTKRSFAK